jgi:hypothetical protein
LLVLISDWDAWVARRVDSFRFSGDDERVLERRQSMDFVAPPELNQVDPAQAHALGGWPVPVTFVNKWRLQQFSLRDEDGTALPLVPRSQSVPIAAGMLIALANFVLTKKFEPERGRAVPPEVAGALVRIVASDPNDALEECARFGEDWEKNLGAGAAKAKDKLSSDLVFMSLAYELARGFLLLALYPSPPSGRRIVKFGYSSYVVPAERDRWPVRFGHTLRTMCNWSRDRMDSGWWKTRSRLDQRQIGRAVISTRCEMGSRDLREGGPSIACVQLRISGPKRSTRTVRMRPNTAIAIDGLPRGSYAVHVKGRSGFVVDDKEDHAFEISPGAAARVEVRARRADVSKRYVWAPPLLARPASNLRALSRGLAWHSKPLALRVRVGDGGSYHCEFEAPPGMHTTRARLVTDAQGERGPLRLLDVVLASTQFAHLYAPAQQARPAAGYAYFNLRPRVETIARPAFTTAMVAAIMLFFLLLSWDPRRGFEEHGPKDSSALLVLLLGAPTALAAYFAQAVPSRVTNSMLYGLRLAAILPAVLVVAAAGVILVGQDRQWADESLWALFLLAVVTIVALWFAQHYAEHPREQRRIDPRQGAGFQRQFSVSAAPDRPADSAPRSTPATVSDAAETIDPCAVRDRLLERAGGMSSSTLRALLSQPWRIGWDSRIPPALYFDSAETAPTFLGLASEDDVAKLRSQLGGRD